MEETKDVSILEHLLSPQGDERHAISALEEDRAEPSDFPRMISEAHLQKEHAVVELGKRVLYWESKAAALKGFFAPYLEAYEAELAFIESRASRSKTAISALVPAGTELVNETISVSWRISERGEITDPDLIPLEYCKVAEPKPSLEALKAAIKANRELKIPGYALRKEFNLQIKPGGARAKSNAKARERKRLTNQEGSDE